MAPKRKRPALVRARTDSDPEDIATPAHAPPPESDQAFPRGDFSQSNVSDHGVTLPATEDSRTPREKVLETTETFEIVLSFLPLKSLLTCRRLSKRVKDDIDGSLLLRETMFLRPTRVPREAWRLDLEIDGSGKGITSVRPVAGMIPLPGGIATGYMQARHPTPHMIRTPAILNPIFPNRRDGAPDSFDSRDRCDYVFTSEIVRHIGKGNTDRQDRILDMYLTQPPCRQAWVDASFSIRRGPSNPSEVSYLACSALLELGTGITIRHLTTAASTLRGVVSVRRMGPKPPRKKNKRWSYTNWEPRKHKKPPPRPLSAAELFPNATMFEILRSLDLEDAAPSADDIQAGVTCWFLDTIVPTDEMRAGVAPYTEDSTQ